MRQTGAGKLDCEKMRSLEEGKHQLESEISSLLTLSKTSLEMKVMQIIIKCPLSDLLLPMNFDDNTSYIIYHGRELLPSTTCELAYASRRL